MDYFVTKYDTNHSGGADCAVLEDSIMKKGSPVTAGSRMLADFISPIDATAVTKLESAGVTILGKMRMDEFGVGGLFPSLETSSCSGAAAAVADGVAAFALCNDYTGAVSLEAAALGLYYIQPTYGTVSRYGLVPAVASMDQIGIICKSLVEGFRALSIISGFDDKDGVMQAEQRLDNDNAQPMEHPEHKLRIALPKNVFSDNFDSISSHLLERLGDVEIVDIELKYSELYAPVMQILCCAEFSNNISRYDGIKFGYRTKEYTSLQELYTKSRTEAFGLEVKLAALMGALVLSQENYTRLYDKAMRIRRLMRDALQFDQCDIIAAPFPCLSRLCGLPAVTMPCGGNALTLMVAPGREDVLNTVLKDRKHI
ncbi:MAG: amidase family protein [Oscillospiraceae bacterium]|nr:amidase family protein [Oscillospiraceae bacterium]